MSLSRAELEAMDRDELIETVVGLSQTVTDLEQTVSQLENRLDDEREQRQEAARDRARIRETISDESADLRDRINDAEGRVHHERSKLARRVAALEDELGIAATDAVAIAEGGPDAAHMSKLARLVRHGPDAVSDQPTAKMYRAKELVDNWNRWGTVRDDGLGKERRLASVKHDLQTRLEDARDESLEWRQVYRAMELVAEWSDGSIRLKEGGQDEGKYVLVHSLEEDS